MRDLLPLFRSTIEDHDQSDQVVNVIQNVINLWSKAGVRTMDGKKVPKIPPDELEAMFEDGALVQKFANILSQGGGEGGEGGGEGGVNQTEDLQNVVDFLTFILEHTQGVAALVKDLRKAVHKLKIIQGAERKYKRDFFPDPGHSYILPDAAPSDPNSPRTQGLTRQYRIRRQQLFKTIHANPDLDKKFLILLGAMTEFANYYYVAEDAEKHADMGGHEMEDIFKWVEKIKTISGEIGNSFVKSGLRVQKKQGNISIIYDIIDESRRIKGGDFLFIADYIPVEASLEPTNHNLSEVCDQCLKALCHQVIIKPNNEEETQKLNNSTLVSFPKVYSFEVRKDGNVLIYFRPQRALQDNETHVKTYLEKGVLPNIKFKIIKKQLRETEGRKLHF